MKPTSFRGGRFTDERSIFITSLKMKSNHKERIVAWFGAVVGAIFSAVGVIASTCILCAPVCCAGPALVVSGSIVAILGVGLSAFLHEYSMIFIVIGVILFASGVFLMIQNKKSVCALKKEKNEGK